MVATLKINGKDIGEVKDVEYTIGVDLAKDSTDSMVVALQRFGEAASKAGVALSTWSGRVNLRVSHMRRLWKILYPDKIESKGYKIVNHRGRNKLVKL